MGKLHANINNTFEYLDEHFQIIENGKEKIDINYLLSSIEMWIDNTEELFDRIKKNHRCSIESTVFYGLVTMINDELKHKNSYCNNVHIKKWFAKYGVDYKEALSPLVTQYKKEREEAIAENAKSK